MALIVRWVPISTLLFSLSSLELKNIAFGKKAAQFSTIGNNLAKKAVDGNLNTMAATDLEPEQRWIVDLGAVYYICRVTLWNHMYLGESSLVIYYIIWEESRKL